MSSASNREYAGFIRRVLAWAIDFALVMSASLLIVCFLGLCVYFVIQTLGIDPDVQNYILKGTGCILGGLIYLAYFAGFESSKMQATPGKRIVGLIVTDLNGNRITFWRALARLLGKVLSGFLFCFGFLVCIITERKQCLHDILAHTLVWKSSSEPPSSTEQHK